MYSNHMYYNNQASSLEEKEDMSMQAISLSSSVSAQKHFTTYENSKWLLKTIKALCKFCNNPNKYKEIKKELKKRGLVQTHKDNDNIINFNQEKSHQIVAKEELHSTQVNRNESPFPQVYKAIEVISNSELCSVLKIQNLIDKQTYALKALKLTYNDIPKAMHEVQCLAHLKSPRLMRYFSSWIETNHDSQFLTFYIQTEYYEGFNLQNFLQTRSLRLNNDEKILHKILHELATALYEIGEAGIVHRDLQPSNIILRPDFSIVVIGFSISSPIKKVNHHRYSVQPMQTTSFDHVNIDLHGNNSMSINISPLDILCINAAETAVNFQMRRLGSPIYASPQQLNGRKSCPKDDIYSFGIIMFELLANIEGERKRVEFIKQLRNMAVLPEKFIEKYPEESELILKMTSHDPSKRPSAQDIIQTELFAKWKRE